MPLKMTVTIDFEDGTSVRLPMVGLLELIEAHEHNHGLRGAYVDHLPRFKKFEVFLTGETCAPPSLELHADQAYVGRGGACYHDDCQPDAVVSPPALSVQSRRHGTDAGPDP